MATPQAHQAPRPYTGNPYGAPLPEKFKGAIPAGFQFDRDRWNSRSRTLRAQLRDARGDEQASFIITELLRRDYTLEWEAQIQRFHLRAALAVRYAGLTSDDLTVRLLDAVKRKPAPKMREALQDLIPLADHLADPRLKDLGRVIAAYPHLDHRSEGASDLFDAWYELALSLVANELEVAS